MPPKPITLDTLSNLTRIENLLKATLYEILGIKDKLTVPEMGYREGTTGYFVHTLALKISDKIDEIGQKLGKEKFKKFDFSKTKLTQEIIEEIWMNVSSLLAEQNESLYKSGNHEIPELRKLLEETSFFPGIKAPHKMWDPKHQEYYESERKRILENLDRINDANDFIAKFKNDFFGYFKKEYGLFNELEAEIKHELKLR